MPGILGDARVWNCSDLKVQAGLTGLETLHTGRVKSRYDMQVIYSLNGAQRSSYVGCPDIRGDSFV